MNKLSTYETPNVDIVLIHLEGSGFLAGSEGQNYLPPVTIDDDDTPITPKPIW